MNKSKINSGKGFTLVEILIAILIFSIVISILFSSFKAFIISSETIKADVTHNETIRNIVRRISMDLEALYVIQPPRYQKPQFGSDPDPYRFVGEKITMGQDMVSTLTFTSLAHVNTGTDQRRGVARIAYYVKENEMHLYTLFRSDSLSPFPDRPESCNDPILCADISGFEIIYKDQNNEEYQTWDSDAKELKYAFPASVDFKITFGSGENIRISEFSIDPGPGRLPID